MNTSKHSLRAKITSLWRDYRWIILGLLWLTAFGLSYNGFHIHLSSLQEPHTPLDLIFLTIQLFTLNEGALLGEKNIQIEIARFLAPSIAAYTVFQTLAVVFRDQFQSIRLRFLNDHVIICGLGKKGALYAKGFLNNGLDVVIIEANSNNPSLEDLKSEGAYTILGNANDASNLQKAGIEKARHFIVTCGNDGTNVDVGMLSGDLCKNRTRQALNCFLHIVDPEFRMLLKDQEFKMGDRSGIRYEFFNIFEKGAQSLFNEYPLFDGNTKKADQFVIIGFEELGQQLLIHTARRWYRIQSNPNGKLQVSIYDPNANPLLKKLSFQYPHLTEVCEIQTHSINPKDDHFTGTSLAQADSGGQKKSKVYICLDDDPLSLKIGYRIHSFMRDQVSSIIIQTDHFRGLAELIRTRRENIKQQPRILPYGLYDRTCSPDLLLNGSHEMIARAIHTEYLAYQSKSQGDQSTAVLSPWETLSKEYQESCREQADHIVNKLNSIGCDLALLSDWDDPLINFTDHEIEIMAMLEHERWMREKQSAGWVWGPEKDEQKKTNPNITTWEELPENIKELNRDMVRNLPDTLSKVGLKIYRTEK